MIDRKGVRRGRVVVRVRQAQVLQIKQTNNIINKKRGNIRAYQETRRTYNRQLTRPTRTDETEEGKKGKEGRKGRMQRL